MKIKEGFEIKKISDHYIVIPSNEINFKAIITLNNSGKLLFESLKETQTIESLTNILINTYDVSYELANSDVIKFIDVLKKHNLLV